MNHQPFEHWLLSDEPLTPQMQQALQEHLAICDQCRRLKVSLEHIDNLFAESSMVEPREGFSNRWLARVAAAEETRKVAKQRWQSWIWLAIIFVGLVVSFGVMGYQLSGYLLHPVSVLIETVFQITSVLVLLHNVMEIGMVLVKILPKVIKPTVWGGMLSAMVMGSFLWFLILQRFVCSGRRVKR